MIHYNVVSRLVYSFCGKAYSLTWRLKSLVIIFSRASHFMDDICNTNNIL